MTRALHTVRLGVLISVLLSGCASLAPSQAKPIPELARADPARFIVVTLRNAPQAQAEHPGSTPRGYDSAGHYGVTGSAERQARALERDYGLRQVSAWPIATLHVQCIMFRLPGADSRSTLLAQLGNDRRVESVQPLNEFATESTPEGLSFPADVPPVSVPYNDPYAHLQVSLRELAVIDAQRRTRGAGVQVAVIDTGVDFDHPDLKGQVIARHNFVDVDEARFAQDMHGTEVAGVIAAVADNGIGIVGVAPQAQLIALKACWQTTAGAAASCNSFTLAQALEAAIVARAAIVNMSLAGPPDPLLSRLIQQGAAQGTIFVGAAGRSGASSFPADLAQVLAVDAAEDRSGNPQHLQAPGRDVLTLVPGGHYDFASGSSLAAAEVSGIVALLLTQNPHLNASQIRTVLLHSTHHVLSPAGEISSVDACTALAQVAHGAVCITP